MSHTYVASLFRHNYRKRVCGLRDAEGRAMPKTERARYVSIVAHREDAPRTADTVVVYYHGSVMQRRILEKDVLYETRIDVGIYYVSRPLVGLKRHLLSHYNQGSGLGLGHIHAGIDYREHILAGIALVAVFLVAEESLEETPPLVVAELDKKALYLVLEKNDKDEQADTHELVEYRADELQLKYLVCQHPHHYECKHAKKDIERAALFHNAVKVEEKEPRNSYVEGVANAKLVQGSLVFLCYNMTEGESVESE